MANHFYGTVEILPAERKGKKHPIKRSVLKFIEKENLPFIVETNRNELPKESKGNWAVTKIYSFFENRGGRAILQGIDFNDEDIEKLYPYLGNAIVKCWFRDEGSVSCKEWFIFVEDGKVAYESCSFENQDMYSSIEYKPKQYMNTHFYDLPEREQEAIKNERASLSIKDNEKMPWE